MRIVTCTPRRGLVEEGTEVVVVAIVVGDIEEILGDLWWVMDVVCV